VPLAVRYAMKETAAYSFRKGRECSADTINTLTKLCDARKLRAVEENMKNFGFNVESPPAYKDLDRPWWRSKSVEVGNPNKG
jgi:hypothetical protein